MKFRTAIALALTGAALIPAVSRAESTYGYNTAGTGTVTATARLNLSVTVAKLILLRVGTAGGTVDTAAWTVGASIPATPTVPVNGNNTAVNWNGAVPTFAVSGNQTFTVYAWTNSTTGTINCAVGTWTVPAGAGVNVPTNANFAVTATGTLPHPGANLGACASTAFPSNTVATGTWQYALGGTPASWAAGVYSNTVTYTATGL